jgi:hypothetical protein
MKPMQEPAVTAFNDFLKSQLDVPGDAHLTLIQFDNAYEVPVFAMPIQDVPQLTAATYTPRGSTALLDAIGRTIKDTDRRISALPEADQPGKVILAIFTDGEENASREYTAKHISDLIALYRDTQGWEFLFLAANQDAIATAAKMSMAHGTGGNVTYTPDGIRSTGKALARKVRASRLKATGQMDAASVADEAMSLDEVLRQEEEK